MDYKDALNAWGANRLKEQIENQSEFIIKDVEVSIENEDDYSSNGCSCCSPTQNFTPYIGIAGVFVSKKTKRRKRVYARMNQHDFDFADFLREVCESAGGTISSK